MKDQIKVLPKSVSFIFFYINTNMSMIGDFDSLCNRSIFNKVILPHMDSEELSSFFR